MFFIPLLTYIYLPAKRTPEASAPACAGNKFEVTLYLPLWDTHWAVHQYSQGGPVRMNKAHLRKADGQPAHPYLRPCTRPLKEREDHSALGTGCHYCCRHLAAIQRVLLLPPFTTPQHNSTPKPSQHNQNNQHNQQNFTAMELDKRRRTAHSPLTPPQSRSPTASLISKFSSSVPRMTKRSKIPPPLKLDTLTPPPTVHKSQRQGSPGPQRQFSSPLINQVLVAGPWDLGITSSTSSTLMSIDTPTPYQVQKSKSFVKETCCLCEEPITTKLSNERTLELDCEHRCHYNCYLILLNKDDLSELPICSVCDTKTRPLDSTVLDDLFSQTLVEEDYTEPKVISIGDILDFEAPTPIIAHTQTGLLPPIPTSAFRPNLFETSTPYTPQDKMTNNLHSSGFTPSSQSKLASAGSSTSSIFTLRSSNKSSIPRCSVDDLIKPQVSIVSEFPKHSINDNLKTYRMSHMLNFFTNEVLTPHLDNDDSDNQLKSAIHDKVIATLTESLNDIKGVDLSKLPQLRMFDCFDISLDGSTREYVYAFIFDEVLLLVNEELDSVVGTVLIGEHFTSCYRADDKTMVLYFSSASLPELQVHSANKILIAKWVDFFDFKLGQKLSVNLIQMTTNTWDLVDDGSLQLPVDVVKYNELTAKGLDLPIRLMKSLMTAPKRLPCVVVACISAYNDTELDNQVYLRQIKNSLRLILDELEKEDKFGLVIMGRSGKGVLEESETTYFGITSADSSQCDDIIDDLKVYTGSKQNASTKMNCMIKSVEKLSMFWPELETRDVVKKLLMLRCGSAKDDDESYDFKNVLEKGFTIHDVLIAEKYDSFTHKMVDQWFEVDGMRQYHLQRHDDFASFQNSIPKIIQKFKRVLISTLDISMDIDLTSYVSFAPIDPSGKLSSSQSAQHWDLKLKDLEDGHHTNARFEIQLDIEKLLTEYALSKNEFHEIPIMNYAYTYGGKTVDRTFSIKLCINELEPANTLMSPLDAGGSDAYTIEIPLLPPLSSFKDSLFVKNQVETLVIETLSGKGTNGAGSIHELVTWIFGLIRGCSTTHVEFFKNSSFNKYKNFSCYMDELIKKLNSIKGNDTKKNDLLYKLALEEELEWF